MNKVVQFMPYIYLLLAILFAVDAVDKFLVNDQNYMLSAAFTVVGIFMFFFRLRFVKKMKQQQNQNKH